MAYYAKDENGMKRSTIFLMHALHCLGGVDVSGKEILDLCGIDDDYERRQASKSLSNMQSRGYCYNTQVRAKDRCLTITDQGMEFVKKNEESGATDNIFETIGIEPFDRKVPTGKMIEKQRKRQKAHDIKSRRTGYKPPVAQEQERIVEPQIELSLSDAANTAMDSIAAIINRDKAHNDAMKKMFLTAGELLHNSDLLEAAIIELRARTGTSEINQIEE